MVDKSAVASGLIKTGKVLLVIAGCVAYVFAVIIGGLIKEYK